MIFNKKEAQNDTNYTSHNSTLMLKMVTSYSIFLLIILVLFIFLYRSHGISEVCVSHTLGVHVL